LRRLSKTPSLRGSGHPFQGIVAAQNALVDQPEGGDTPDVEGQHEPVWVRPRRITWGKLLKKEDQIKALTNYKSPHVQAGATAVVRSRNAILGASIFAPRLIGNEVPASSNWNGRTVPVDFGTSGTSRVPTRDGHCGKIPGNGDAGTCQ
jgi:hypothetical protein